MTNATSGWASEDPLPKVTCSSHDSAKNLHSFLKQRPRTESYRSEMCVACGAELIDWRRLDHHDLSDAAYTIEALGHELIRHHYWHAEFDQKALDDAFKRGTLGLALAAEKRLRKYVGPRRADIFRDGTQTPRGGKVVFYAQHATATCCRRCIEAWHGIDRNQPLGDVELEYMTKLVMAYIAMRLPYLPAGEAEESEADNRKGPVDV